MLFYILQALSYFFKPMAYKKVPLVISFLFLHIPSETYAQNNFYKNIVQPYSNSVFDCIKTMDGGLLTACYNQTFGEVRLFKTDSSANFINSIGVYNGVSLYRGATVLEHTDSSIFLLTSREGNSGAGQEVVVIKFTPQLTEVWRKVISPLAAYATDPSGFFTKNISGVTDGMVVVYQFYASNNILKSIVTKLDLNGNFLWQRQYQQPGGLGLFNGLELPNGDLMFTGVAINSSTTYLEGVILKTGSTGVIKNESMFSTPQVNNIEGKEIIQNPLKPFEVKIFCRAINPNFLFGAYITVDTTGNITGSKKFTTPQSNQIFQPYYSSELNAFYVSGKYYTDTIPSNPMVPVMALIDSNDVLVNYQSFGDSTSQTFFNIVYATGTNPLNQQVTGVGETKAYGLQVSDNIIARFNFSSPPCPAFTASVQLDSLPITSHSGITDTVFPGVIRTILLNYSYITYPMGNFCSGVNINETALHEIFLTLSPNPSNGVYNITLSEAPHTAVNLKITDMAGNILLNQKKSGNLLSINLSDYANGIYLLEIFNGTKTYRAKLIKEKN